jgi:coenzyme F420-reducing hydrogenase alpha subunit
MSACQAIEAACGVTVEGPIAGLRRLPQCGEWIESHALLPDRAGRRAGPLGPGVPRRRVARPGLDDAELTRQCEQAIGSYDPCISCSARFLDLTVERSLWIPNGAWFSCQVLAASRSW